MIKEVLKDENYVEMDPELKNTLEFKIAMSVKEEIRKHKWNQGSEGNIMTWEEAVEDWMKNYYNRYVYFFKNTMWPDKFRRKQTVLTTGSHTSQSSVLPPLHHRI